MTTQRFRGAVHALAVWLGVSAAICLLAAAPPVLDDAFTLFWEASTPRQAEEAADAILKSGAGFDEVYARLKRGRPYSPDVPRGVVRMSHTLGQNRYEYSLEVPERYDPARAYQVRVQLHGGVLGRRDGVVRGSGSIGELAGDEQIYVMPTAWRDAPWWSDAQLENVRAILDTVRRTYNVDENRVALAGVSDGATALYYFAMRDPTPFASFLALNGDPLVLRNPAIGRGTPLFPHNLTNKPFFIVNGALDLLYPTELVEPFINRMRRGGVEVMYRPQPEGTHNTTWWADEVDAFEAFVRDHPRRALPDRLSWETDLGAGTDRFSWLLIRKLSDGGGSSAPRPPLPDINYSEAEREAAAKGGTELLKFALFPRSGRSGRVDLVREGNAVRATTRGVSELTLLISPDAFDFTRPLSVEADGRNVFQGRVTKSVATLMKWAARDNDKTMLFGAEVTVTLP